MKIILRKKKDNSLKELSFRVAKIKETMEKEKGREVTVSEIADRLGVNADEVSDAVCILQPVASLTQNNEDTDSQIDIPVDSEEENVNDKIYVESLMKSLDENDKKIILLRYFNHKTQSETATIMKMSQVQVSRAEKRILTALRRFEEGNEKN